MDRFIKSPLFINTSKGLTTWPLRLSWNHAAFVWFLVLRVGYYTVIRIRKDDMYGGFQVKLSTICETIVTLLSVDIPIGDVAAPLAVQYEFSGIFEDEIQSGFGVIMLKRLWQRKRKLFQLEAFLI